MQHSVTLSGWGCHIRPVTVADAAFIVRLRSQEQAKGNIHATSSSVADQEKWIQNYYDREGDYYWIIEDINNIPVGAMGLYNYNAGLGEGEVGRWVMFPEFSFNLAAPLLLVYRWAFETLNVRRIVFDVVSTNRKVLKFHKLIGARETFLKANALHINDQMVDMQWFEVTREMWPSIFERWDAILA